jgi:transposase-like protein
MRWVLRYAPEFEKRWQEYERPVALSWRVDETYIKVGGHWTYLYRAVDQNGQSVDSFLRKRRDVGAAKRFFGRALQKHYAGCLCSFAPGPCRSGRRAARCSIRRGAFGHALTSIMFVGQDHRGVKRR